MLAEDKWNCVTYWNSSELRVFEISPGVSDHTAFFFIYWFTWKTFAECQLYARSCVKHWSRQWSTHWSKTRPLTCRHSLRDWDCPEDRVKWKWGSWYSHLSSLCFHLSVLQLPNSSLSFLLFIPYSGLAGLAECFAPIFLIFHFPFPSVKVSDRKTLNLIKCIFNNM